MSIERNDAATAPIRLARRGRVEPSRNLGFVETIELTRKAGVDAMGAALAHELNQPLAALSLYLQSLHKRCERVGADPLAMELVQKAEREADRVGELVRRMRRFSSRAEPEREAIDFNALADDCIEMVLMDDRIELTRAFGTELPVIEADPVQIRQVMVNLLRNAVDATSQAARPRILVTTERRVDTVHFSVADNGPGVSAKMVNRLFRAFETSKPDGMGLGLAISRMIAQNHRGDLVLEPMATGACFALRLPVRPV